MAKLIDVNGLKAVVQKINADTKDIRALLEGKAGAVHTHKPEDVVFSDGKTLIEKLAEVQTGGQVDLAGYATEAYVDGKIGEVNTALAGKVDAVEGSRLITDEEVAKLEELANYDDTDVKGRLAALEAIDHEGFAKATDLEGKVDKEEGKVLIPQTELDRLAGLQNYDDAALVGRVAALEAIDHEAFLKADAIADMATKQDLADLEARIGQAAVDAVEEHYEKVEVAEGQEAPADAKVVVADDAVDFDPATQVKVSDVNGVAQVGETVVFVPAQEGQAATGIYETIENKVQEVAGYEVATEEELLAMYDEVNTGEPQV